MNGKRFQYTDYYFDRIIKIGYWKGHYKHHSNWNCKGYENSRYSMKGWNDD